MDRENNHNGHRQRLIEKMQREGLSDYEILEMLLFYVFKRRNTNDLAHRLIARYGSLKQLFLADIDSLQEMEGIGKQAAIFLHALGECNRCLSVKKDRINMGDLKDYKPEEFVKLIEDRYVGLKTEVLDFFLLDKTGSICYSRRFVGTVNSVEIQPAAFSQVIIDAEPSGLIVVHNHPGCNPKPSKDDEDMTKTCQLICSFHNVMFCDHIIVWDGGFYSYYGADRMGQIGRQFSIGNVRKRGDDSQLQDESKNDYPKVFNKNLENLAIEKRDGKYVAVFREEQ